MVRHWVLWLGGFLLMISTTSQLQRKKKIVLHVPKRVHFIHHHVKETDQQHGGGYGALQAGSNPYHFYYPYYYPYGHMPARYPMPAYGGGSYSDNEVSSTKYKSSSKYPYDDKSSTKYPYDTKKYPSDDMSSLKYPYDTKKYPYDDKSSTKYSHDDKDWLKYHYDLKKSKKHTHDYDQSKYGDSENGSYRYSYPRYRPGTVDDDHHHHHHSHKSRGYGHWPMERLYDVSSGSGSNYLQDTNAYGHYWQWPAYATNHYGHPLYHYER